MATKKKLLEAAAGAAGGAALNVEDVFSTYVWSGDGTSGRNIVNGIDLANEGGAVWTKRRDTTGAPHLFNTISGANKYLLTSSTAAEDTYTSLTSFNDNGFTVANYAQLNNSAGTYASWTFRKAPKFFTCLTYTGDGTTGRTISHDLGSRPGFIAIKRTDAAGNWFCVARNSDTNAWTSNQSLSYDFGFNATDRGDLGSFATIADATTINLNIGALAANSTTTTNISGASYIAYLWAHNDGDGDFGPTGDQDIIKCGSYTGNGSTAGLEVDLGFEPQWVLIKQASAAENWVVFDAMRGVITGGSDDAILYPNLTAAENPANRIAFTPTGFKLEGNNSETNASSTYIYIAIRRGPMAVPESATEVFAQDYRGSDDPTVPPRWRSPFPVDFQFNKLADATGGWLASSRLQGTSFLSLNTTDAESTLTTQMWDYMNGHGSGSTTTNVDYWSWMWRRAPSFMDVVAYTGTGANQTISHNLGVAPKFMIVKERTTPNNWVCYLEALGNDKRMGLNAASSVATDTTAWQSTTPTDSAFYVGANTQTNVSNEKFIAYLFGEVAGISKFGTYTGTGAAQNIDCGFSSGARFVLIKTYAGTNPNANWNIWDSERGIVAGNDPYLALNSTAAQVTSTDVIDPYSSGFSLTSSGVANNSGTSYWYYAIA